MMLTQEFEDLCHKLEKCSLFQLNHLNNLILEGLSCSKKIAALRAQLKIGMNIQYFEHKENVLIDAKIIEIKKTRVLVVHLKDNQRFNIPFSFIHFPATELPIRNKSKLDKLSLSVGNKVGFQSKGGQDVFGWVEKLNPKRALVRLASGERWMVSYPLLFLVVDGDYKTSQSSQLCLEGEVLNRVEL